MNTELFTFTTDRKQKGRKSSLQWLFSDLAEGVTNGTRVRRISDKRNVGVCTKDFKKTTAGTGKERRGSDSDGLLGSMLIEHMIGGAITSLLPLFFQSADISSMIDAADEFYCERVDAKPAQEITYFPSYALC